MAQQELIVPPTATTAKVDQSMFDSEEWEKMKKDAWFVTFTGRKFRAFDPQPEDIHITDIAHHLALVNRYNGATRFPLSVAQHSLLVASQAPERYKLEGLMHDASEAYIMDVPRPWKPFFVGYKDTENYLMSVIADKYGFEWPEPAVIKVVDEKILHTEAAILLPGADWVDHKQRYHGVPIQEWPWKKAEELFLDAFTGLRK